VMVIVVEPGQRSLDCAKTVIEMSKEIGLKNFVIVGNKITNEDDKNFIKEEFTLRHKGSENADKDIFFLPYSERIRNSDRDGVSVLDGMNDGEKEVIEKLIDSIL